MWQHIPPHVPARGRAAPPPRPRAQLILRGAPWKQGTLRRERRARHRARHRAAPHGRRRRRLEPRVLLRGSAGRLRRRVGPYLQAGGVAVIPGNRLGHPAAPGQHGVEDLRREVAPGILPRASPSPALLSREHLRVVSPGGESRGSSRLSFYDAPAHPLVLRRRPAASAREGGAAGATNPATAKQETVVELVEAGAEWERRGWVGPGGQRPASRQWLLLLRRLF